MKSFSTFVVLATSAALVSAAGPVYNSTTGTFACPIANATYCAGDSLGTNIIIRCIGFNGYPGNCNDNLDGEFPQGLNPTLCWASPTVDGVAACEKNCVVYGGSGNYNGTFTLPNCTPYATQTTTIATSTTAATSTKTAAPTTTSSSGPAYTTTTTSIVTTVSSIQPTTSTSATATSAPATLSTSFAGTGISTTSTSSGNWTVGTTSRVTASAATTTKSSSPTFSPNAGNTNTASVFIAAVGLFAAYLL